MNNWHNVILVITLAATLVVGTNTTGRDDAFQKQRRFLFSRTTASMNFCNFSCPLSCTNGYVVSSTGCFLCQCTEIASTTGTLVDGAQTLINGGIFLDNPCNQTVRQCRLNCTFGFELGTNDCQFCSCQNSTSSTDQPTTTSLRMSTLLTTASSLLTTISLTSPTPVSQTTLSQNKHGLHFNDPCIPSQQSCDKDCSGDYVKGPGGCQYCLCGARIPPEFRTTVSPEVTENTTVTHNLDLSPTSTACIMAKLICNQKCSLGFISHPDDCLFCSCQKANLDEVNDAPTIVYLSNPCLQGYSECGMTCANGYISGPRDCELCSCR